jgi:EAL domain-containing protein (putative c-di-GMP-specific phosphodiesterase class I)/GGDEF domain-containing protein
MTGRYRDLGRRLFTASGRALQRLDVLALFPLVALVALALGLDDLFLLTAFGLPALLALRALGPSLPDPSLAARHGPSPRDRVLAALGQVALQDGRDTACILVQIEEWDDLVSRWGLEGAGGLADRCHDRLRATLRADDLILRLGDARFAIVLHPLPHLRLGTREAIVARLAACMAEPVGLGGAMLRPTAAIGHTALIRDTSDPATATLDAAEAALADAHRNGPNASRAFAPGLLRHRRTRAELAADVDAALAAGEIRPWFQPQVHAESRVISGFEALARWHHPDRGLLVPSEFLPAIDDSGRMDALGRCILTHALEALRLWDRAGLRVPTVAINLSAPELRNPALADHLKWDLDRFDIAPGRLTVEIPETLVARGEDDSLIATLAALGQHGIALDLDDFGIGQASLPAIRRFGIARIKIDRSFIFGLDADPDRQAMVAAILAMAKPLGVRTLAEGVEDSATLVRLARMGCDHAQGHHIAAAMPVEDTIAWATGHNTGLARPAPIGLRAG